MALNIPNQKSPADVFSTSFDSGAMIGNRLMQNLLQKAQMKQQQDQFAKNYLISQAKENRAASLQPYLMQNYQDTHNTAANDLKTKLFYQSLIQGALNGSSSGSPSVSSGAPAGAPPSVSAVTPANILNTGAATSADTGLPPGASSQDVSQQANQGAAPAVAAAPAMNASLGAQEQELRAGNPNLLKLDRVAGLVPGIPKPATHYSNGIIYTTYPSGRMTAQSVNLPMAKTPAEKNTSAKQAIKLRDQATALINSANLVQQGYDIMDANPDLTGPVTDLASGFGLVNSQPLGQFKTVTGKLQAELGKIASSRGGIQAVKWAGGVKPSTQNPEATNYGMFNGLRSDLTNNYNILNAQYKAETGQDLPLKLPQMTTKRGDSAGQSSGIKVLNGKKYEKINGKWHVHN